VAVNLGLDAAKSGWVTYLCDDDVYLPGRFELYLPMLEKADAVVGNAYFVQDSGAVWHQNKFRFNYPKPRTTGHQLLLEAIQPNHFICHDSICHRRTRLRWPIDIQPTPNDWRYWCSLFKSGFRFLRVEEVGERATMPGMWRAGATQEGVMGLTGEEITGGNMQRVMYAKNITNKRQKVINSKNVSIMVYPGERINAEDVSFTNAKGITCLFPGFALCGDFSFPDLAKIEGAPAPAREPPTVLRRVFQDEALQVPRTFEPIARIAGGTVLTTPNHEPKHPFDLS
jgi:glycosyltransferase involved in cell wall biosynthesis